MLRKLRSGKFPYTLNLALATVCMVVVGTALAAVLGVIHASASSVLGVIVGFPRRSTTTPPHPAARWLVRGLIVACWSISDLVFAIIIFAFVVLLIEILTNWLRKQLICPLGNPSPQSKASGPPIPRRPGMAAAMPGRLRLPRRLPWYEKILETLRYPETSHPAEIKHAPDVRSFRGMQSFHVPCPAGGPSWGNR